MEFLNSLLVFMFIALVSLLQVAMPFRTISGIGKVNNLAVRLSKNENTKEASTEPLKVLLLVEPTPFNYISGYANRFKEMLRYLKLAGDKVQVITPDCDPKPPAQFQGYPITSPRGFQLPMYKKVTLTLDFLGAIPKVIRSFKPQIVHVSSPSCILFPAIFWARWLNVPLVLSYHTDLAGYVKAYFPLFHKILVPTFNWLIRRCHSLADLTLCTSPQLKDQMLQLGVRRVDVWRKGVNTEVVLYLYMSDFILEF